MSPEIFLPILIVAAGIIIFLLRRTSEVAAPKHPASEAATHKEALPLQQDEDRIMITHPFIRRAAEKALAHGGKGAKYIVQDGDRIYFAFGRIEDPVQRKNAADLIKTIQDSGQVNIIEFIRFVRRVLNK